MSFDISRYTVLVADDDPATLKLANLILDDADFDTVLVEDGRQAWRELEADPARFDAVLLDRRMPGLGGLDVLQRMKGHRATRDIPAVLLSGDAASGDIAEGIKAGAYHYVTKPYDPVLLVAVLRAAIEDYRSYLDVRQQLQYHADARQQLQHTLCAIGLLENAEFRCRTPDEARSLAALLAGITPAPETVVTGLWELLNNAIEHGNLGISYAEKSALLNAGRWQEEITRRLAAPEYSRRSVSVSVHREVACVRFRIADQGSGFDPAPFLDFVPERATHAHGRGIAMARHLCFGTLLYLGAGNVVEAEVAVPAVEKHPTRLALVDCGVQALSGAA